MLPCCSNEGYQRRRYESWRSNTAPDTSHLAGLILPITDIAEFAPQPPTQFMMASNILGTRPKKLVLFDIDYTLTIPRQVCLILIYS
jgi:hypothetical protein